MIHVINKHNRHLYYSVLDDMHRLRHKVFVEQRGWKKLEKLDGYEIDEFDNEETTYFLKLDRDMRILGGMRMCPTTGPTQLNTIFKDTCVLDPQPVGAEHYEWSRYFIVDTKYRSALGKPVHYELYAGILEYAIARGIKTLSGFIETATYTRSLNMPWDMKQLGLPAEYGGSHGEPIGYGLPTILTLDTIALRKTKIFWRMRKPVLSLSLGELTPFAEIGFKPAVVLAVEEFIAEHPEHIEIVAAYAEALQAVDASTRIKAAEVIADLSDQELAIDFSPSMLNKINVTNISVAAQ
ncbi:acyl-homoserine-lactone synthase [Kordiimonas aquimaris]|uniref:acyl-homoserine-lactone synthase n=1 Tax=Kordiimonas aquimaris TaxID=707591 RepID=UPI0021CF2B76|nr:acyl-homoserine-lactone synthase [Kordiimonas aquimaris]